MSDDYLARLKKMKIQNTPTSDSAKNDRRVNESENKEACGTFGTGTTGHVLEIDAQPAVAESHELSHPAPRIVKEPPFGSDGVPSRYLTAWHDLLAQFPPGVKPLIWEAAIYDAASLFGTWGAELERLRWTAGDLFDVSYDGRQGGLAWFLHGEHVVALGPGRAFTETRVFDRARS